MQVCDEVRASTAIASRRDAWRWARRADLEIELRP